MSTKFVAVLSLTRNMNMTRDGSGAQPVCLSVHDAASGCEILTIEMSPLEFGELVTRPMDVRGPTVEIHTKILRFVGCTSEQKIVDIPTLGPAHFAREDDQAAQAAPIFAVYEVDGWRGNASDLYNGHRRIKTLNGYAQRVSFFRMVHPDGTPVLPEKETPDAPHT